MAPDLTPGQLEAIEWRRQDACVLAGPGSGKTTVLVERYRRLIKDHGFEPREILAITFTEKAAANMKAKVAEQFRHEPAYLRDLETSSWVSTIHGFCARLLRENAIAAGIDPKFRVLDARESDELQFDCINAALDEFVESRRADSLALIAALPSPGIIASDLKSVYDAIRSAGMTIADVRAMPAPIPQADEAALKDVLCQLLDTWSGDLSSVQHVHRTALRTWASGMTLELGQNVPVNLGRTPKEHRPAMEKFRDTFEACTVDRHAAPFRAMIFAILARFEELYDLRKTETGALDFNDLERRAIRLLRANEDVRQRVRTQFRQVMLDEFQDINEQQWALINLVRGEDVFFGVGDINQSIYAFRHARPKIFQEWREQILAGGKHTAELLENFRSREEILRAVESGLNETEGIDPRELIAAAQFTPKQGPSTEVLKIQSEDRDEAAGREARWIAHRILSLHDRFNFGDFAILCRNSDSMRPVLEALGHSAIPYVCGRRQSSLLSREGLDVTALLSAIANPRDSVSLVTALRSPLVGIGDESLLRLRLLAGSVTGGLNLIAHNPERLAEFDARDAAALARFAADLKRWRSEQPVLPLDLLIIRALDDCGFPPSENVESYLQIARTRGDHGNLLRFLREIESLQDAISSESDLSDRDQGDRVQVMTAHAAKGLEFPVVVIAAMDKGTRMGSASVTFTPEHGLGLKWKAPTKKEPVADSWQTHNSELLKQRDKEEANRLLYVAMTRAKEHLILSYSMSDRRTSPWVKIVESLPDITPFETGDEPPALRYEPDALASQEVLTVPRPEAVDQIDQYDSAISVTSLAVFAECPRKYYIERYLGWSAPRHGGRASETPAAELGSMVHEILAGKSAIWPTEASHLADAFRTSELGRQAAAAKRSEREWEFIADIDGTLVRGTIDLWFEDETGLRIVDYKTDNSVKTEPYRQQLALYAMALERAEGRRPSQAHLHFLRSNTVVEVPLDDAAILETRSLIARVREAQNTLKFDMYVGEHCHSCPYYRGFCPAILEA